MYWCDIKILCLYCLFFSEKCVGNLAYIWCKKASHVPNVRSYNLCECEMKWLVFQSFLRLVCWHSSQFNSRHPCVSQKFPQYYLWSSANIWWPYLVSTYIIFSALYTTAKRTRTNVRQNFKFWQDCVFFFFSVCYTDGWHRPSTRHSMLDCVRSESGELPCIQLLQCSLAELHSSANFFKLLL